MERILKEEGVETCAMIQEQLGYEVGLKCIGKMVKNAMGSIQDRKCIAYKKGWVNEKTARDCKAQTKVIKEKYTRSEDQHCIRFSDEVHFGYGP